jgi:outer membrane immunogenic protein
MQRFIAALLSATVVGIASASAADLPVKAPPLPVVTAYNWTGCYLGAQAGYGWGRDSDHETVTATGVTSIFSPLNSASLSGGKLGGYLGCNWQMPGSAFVFGVEGDGEWANDKGSTNFHTPAPPDYYNAKIRWDGSLRGRVGYAFNNVLLYATGGVAFANINEQDVVGGGAPSTSNSSTRTGWTLGAGLDFAFAPRWIARVEYRYADYGTYSYHPVVFGGFTENHKVTDNTIRFGIAYKFF